MVELGCDYIGLVPEADVSLSSKRRRIQYLDTSIYIRNHGNMIQYNLCTSL